MAEKIPYGNKSLKSDPGTVNDTVREQTAEPTVEEMARELAEADECPDKTGDVECVEWQLKFNRTCEDCWLKCATPSDIRTRYQQMKGERG